MDLSETAIFTKRALVILTALVVLIYSGKFAIKTGKKIWIRYNPPKEKPTVLFGKLPLLKIPSLKLAEGATPTYIVDTQTGRIPNFGSLIPVFKVITPSVTHRYEENATSLASRLGFTENYNTVSASVYSWKNNDSTLKMNVITRSFEISTDWSKVKVQTGTSPFPTEAKQKAQSFLSSAGVSLEDYEASDTHFAVIEGASLREVSSVSESQVTVVEFVRTLKPGQYPYKVLGENPKKGLIRIAICGVRENEGQVFLDGRYMFRTIDKKSFATYPVKTASQAYEELQEGKGAITYLKPEGENFFSSYKPLKPAKIKIREISLAYYEPEAVPTYLQPIFVFEGKTFSENNEEGDFIAYVPAVSEEWVK